MALLPSKEYLLFATPRVVERQDQWLEVVLFRTRLSVEYRDFHADIEEKGFVIRDSDLVRPLVEKEKAKCTYSPFLHQMAVSQLKRQYQYISDRGQNIQFSLPVYTVAGSCDNCPLYLTKQNGLGLIPIWTDEELQQEFLGKRADLARVRRLELCTFTQIARCLDQCPREVRRVLFNPNNSTPNGTSSTDRDSFAAWLERHATSRNEASLFRLADTFRMVDRAIKARAFYPIESQFNCSGCTFRQSCREWQISSMPEKAREQTREVQAITC